MKKALLGVFVGMVVVSSLCADDWPQFRGPERSGVSKEKGLLKAWPKGGPKLAWTFKDAGLGFSSVAVVKGVVYTLGTDFDVKKPNNSAKDEYVIAINEKDGKELWRHKIGPLYTYKGNAYGDGPRSTPTIDGNFLYALGGQGQLVCIDIAKKKEVWSKNLLTDLGGAIMDKYGFSESPLIDGDQLICTPGGSKGTLAALDKSTGNVLWRSKGLINEAPFSSIVVAEFYGKRQYIQTGYSNEPGKIRGELSGVEAKTGNLLWTKTIFTNTNDGIGTSAIVNGNQVYITAGFGGGCHLFEINKKQEAVEQYKKPIWKKVKNTHGGVVLIDGHIYGHSERDMWICQELKSGDIAWADGITLTCASGAITAAEGKLYLYSDKGEVGLVDADPKAFNLVSDFELPVKSTVPAVRITSRSAKIWAHPVIANGRLYLRDQEYVFAFDIAK